MKDTLQMPQTDFNMKASLHVKEPVMQEEWLEEKVYENILKTNEDKTPFVFVDGPPYANGSLHTGHALNKVLKDIILRYKNSSGYRAEVIWGWDTHGLPIENALLKNKKIKRNELTDVEFRKLCEEYANNQIAIQKEQFMRLGILEGNKRIYRTLDKDYEAEQIKVFKEMVNQGLIFKGLKPVYWSYSSQTALADAEIEYKDVKSPAIYVNIPVISEGYENTGIIIWTTTPWTIPVNNGVSVHPEMKYVTVSVNDYNYILAEDLLEDVASQLSWENYEVINKVFGSELENIKLENITHPNRTEIVMLGEHVTADSGTGVVHTAGAHGEEDFAVSKQYGIEPLSAMNSVGKMTSNAGKYEGMFYEDANKEITKDLDENGNLLKLYFFTHSAPHDWRTKKPVVYRATEQWFATIEPVKKGMLEAVNEVEYISDWAKTRLYNMIEGRNEWCISRQRKWGVPIPIFYDENDEPIFDDILFDHVSDLFKEYGSDIWFDKDAKDLMPEGYTNVNSPNGIFRKEMDIMDVWFDSGSASQAVGKNRLGHYPADLYLEGSDQYRGWFNSSLIIGYITSGAAPFKKLISHGFVLDGKGNKMSKSLGNTIDPIKIINQKGADIIRLWTSSVDYQSDVRISNDIIEQVSEVYRRYRNTIRFMLGNTFDFDESMIVEYKEMNKFDKYMMIRLKELTNEVINAYENYSFNKITDLINNYITTELSAFYLDYIKDVTYISRKNDHDRRSVQTVLYYHLEQLLTLMSPILTHTTYEAYKLFKDEVIFYQEIKTIDVEKDQELYDNAQEFLEFRKVVNKAIEGLRDDKLIGKSFEVEVTINPNEKGKKILSYFENLDLYLIVSRVTLTDEPVTGYTSELGTISVAKYDAAECNRCRKYFTIEQVTEVFMDDERYEVCEHCKEIIDEFEA